MAPKPHVDDLENKLRGAIDTYERERERVECHLCSLSLGAAAWARAVRPRELAMPVPGHRDDCSSKLWRTRCPNCRKTVFFFSCSCGSRVFFDAPGDPWPRHECTTTTGRAINPQAALRRGAQGLPLLSVTPEGDERQVAGKIIQADAESARGAPYVEVTLEEPAESTSPLAMQITFLVPRRLYLSLHCQPGDQLWALLKPPPVDGGLWVADEVRLLK
jgi:hypothetical protein